ncbi:coenzyme F420-0:L-glutamate ligase [Sphingobium sufflavum]|uniref:coenzyme F420-0:L-glutamate ligase n=1 Tax=Sphingobium sufflavum TaxID=1129547 RepID=UPI001F2B8FDD|nr:coenzyme F420-0:L-glutamate ligase [Sphingobium sufflavum]MCE7795456.1 coenzyme F420-0:L-glutamate ligase [Sphingobium sufflavum]
MIQIEAVPGIGEVAPGCDLGAILADALGPMQVQAGDILVVTSKICSKAEGRRLSLATVAPGARADEIAGAIGKDARLVELALRESTDVVRTGRNVLITRHRLGLVMANAGIDASNIGTDAEDMVLLLPEDPDASAQAIRAAIAQRLDVDVGVVLSDSFGRPWRHGVVNVAIGAAGLPAIIDRRGDTDRDGRVLQVTQIAYGDLLASAAGLAMGEGAEGIPAVLVRGVTLGAGEDAAPATRLVRPLNEDLFR